ncbi:MAG: polyphosphate polymerase domain-containing protein [Planctomycetes bacterium]|nr:polyphosphate polymerase domain-containing protein [Planctomycetota bacterium]
MTYHEKHECKFVIGEDLAARLLRRFAPFVEPDPFAARSPTHSYSIASLYLDDDCHTLYRETLAGLPHRFKLRVRGYSDDPASPVFLEIKRRHDRVVQKLRCPIDRALLPAVLAGVPDAVPGLPPSKQAALRDFQRLQQMRGAAPQVLVRYEREAYVARDDADLRVTFDRRLAAMPESAPVVRLQDRRYALLPRRGLVLELKFTGRCPAWMLDAVQACELHRTSFSKYCRSLDSLHVLPFADA